MGGHPYSELPPNRFWRSGVSEQHPLTIDGLYRRKFIISPGDQIATAGSCFAQHLATHMRKRGYNILDTEPAVPGMSTETAHQFGYSLYSARYGNIYTVRQLLQLLQDSDSECVREEDIWEKNKRYFDAMRPGVDPNGLASPEEIRAHRLHHLRMVRRLFEQADVFVFTLGLTEAWAHRSTGIVYPVCPGVMAGTYDRATYEFRNFEYPEIYADLLAVRDLLKSKNANMRFLLTVSPVPLTATASEDHVLVATTWSKSTLRAVCGAMARQFDDVDYFPSYEIIASPFSRGFFYAPNLRSVTSAGVEAVMRVFFSQHRLDEPSAPVPARDAPRSQNDDELVCEEMLLGAFG